MLNNRCLLLSLSYIEFTVEFARTSSVDLVIVTQLSYGILSNRITDYTACFALRH